MPRQLNDSNHRSGSAMFETMLVIPFLLFLLLILFYVGKDSVRGQHASSMVRYEAWRDATAQGVPAPQADGARGHPQLNSVFFGDGAARLQGQVSQAFPPTAMDNLIFALGDPDAATLTTELAHHFDHGRTAAFSTTHTDDLSFWQRFNGPMQRRHVRIGHNWRFVNGWRFVGNTDDWVHAGSGPWLLNPPAQEAFFSSIEQPLADFADSGNILADSIRSVYRAKPGYVGPTVYRP